MYSIFKIQKGWFVIFIGIIFLCSFSLLQSFDQNVIIYLVNGEIFQGRLLEINDKNIMINKILFKDVSMMNIPRNKIIKILVEDEAMEENGTKINIHYKNFVKMNQEIKGIDFEKNILIIDSIYLNYKGTYTHKRDSLDLSDTNIIRVSIDSKSPVFNGLVRKPLNGLYGGSLTGVGLGLILGFSTNHIISSMIFGGLAGGIVGSGIGLLVGVGHIIINSNNDVTYKYHPDIKNLLVRFIYYPDVKYTENN